jgi:hypothetical protein
LQPLTIYSGNEVILEAGAGSAIKAGNSAIVRAGAIRLRNDFTWPLGPTLHVQSVAAN